jgi:hypothetical protein
MKYARENVLRRRHVKGTARSVEFSPAAGSQNSFKELLVKNMPYRNLMAEGLAVAAKKPAKKAPAKKAAKKAPAKKKAAKKKK